MSQIARGFVLAEDDLLAAAGQLAAGGDGAFGAHAFDPYPWPGYVVLVLVEWLRDRGAAPPIATDGAPAGIVAAHDPLFLAKGEALATFFAALDRLAPDDAARLQFWQEWTGETDEAAAPTLREGWDWMRRLAGVAAERGAWCLLLEG